MLFQRAGSDFLAQVVAWQITVGGMGWSVRRYRQHDRRTSQIHTRIVLPVRRSTTQRHCPAGNSIFFHVKRIEDPIGLLPAKLILGINKRGVHFFRPVCSVCLGGGATCLSS